jgi:hypothetical protein
MTPIVHRITLSLYYTVVLVALIALTYNGFSYYQLPVEGIGRVDHPMYKLLNPAGFIGHGLGIFGSLFIVVGLFSYMARKRLRIFSRAGLLKHWLEFHIFMCTLGTVFVLFHTSFKFGGIVAIGFWSLAVVWISGVAGRFIYLQIPHSIEGRELNLQEVKDLREELEIKLKSRYGIQTSEMNTVGRFRLRSAIKEKNISRKDSFKVRRLILKERALNSRIRRLLTMQRFFRYWHVIHLPFALIMLIIMVIHVAVVLFFGYKWIF